MKLEVGKKYLNRRGEIVEIIDKFDRHYHYYPFLDSEGTTYTNEGSVWEDGDVSDYDLIGEVVDKTVREAYNEIVEEVFKEHEKTMQDLSKIEEPIKNNKNKPQIGLVRPQFIEGIAQVLTYGATKYNEPRGSEPNYMRGEGFPYSEIYDSLQRHLNTWYSGESLDEETKMNHLLHAASNLMFLYMYEISDKGVDDRFIVEKEDGQE